MLWLPLLLSPAFAQKYVATDGNDANPGTLAMPFRTIPKAIAVAAPGDTIYVRGGAYALSNSISISASQSGTESQRYCLFAYSEEKPLLDFSSSPFGRKGINLSASYWHLKGFAVKGAGDNGLEINGGSHNIIERCAFFENRDSGVQLSNGAAHNRISNCDSYYNADPPDFGDADGFAPKLTVGTGNYFYGCRAWGNCDDGWDGYMRGATDVTTTLENCWTWGNGYLKDGTDPGSQANGNGFKMGGGDNGNSELLMHHFILKHCLAFNNKLKGFDQNNNVGSMTLLHCTGYNNKDANYRITRALNPGQTFVVKNCVSFSGVVALGAFALQETNGWMNPFVVTAEDFLSLVDSVAASPRNADGSLPEMPFMHLAPGSDLIDAGVALDLPFHGKAPDLGAFESDFASAVAEENFLPSAFRLEQNYPNPFNPATTLQFYLPKAAHTRLTLHEVTGRLAATLFEGELASGTHRMVLQAGRLASGVYFYKITTPDFVQTKKMLLVR